MINKFKKLFYKVSNQQELFLPKEEIVLKNNWLVCPINEDCSYLEVFDKEDYIDKTINFYEDNKSIFHIIIFSFDTQNIIEKEISNNEYNFKKKLEKILDLSTYSEYYESFAITNATEDFLILHSHEDNITFICGNEEFLKFQFDGKKAIEFMDNYQKNILTFASFCKAFPWKKYNILSDNFL